MTKTVLDSVKINWASAVHWREAVTVPNSLWYTIFTYPFPFTWFPREGDMRYHRDSFAACVRGCKCAHMGTHATWLLFPLPFCCFQWIVDLKWHSWLVLSLDNTKELTHLPWNLQWIVEEWCLSISALLWGLGFQNSVNSSASCCFPVCHTVWETPNCSLPSFQSLK